MRRGYEAGSRRSSRCGAVFDSPPGVTSRPYGPPPGWYHRLDSDRRAATPGMATMAYVRLQVPDRADWPLLVGGLLGASAVIETVARADRTGMNLSVVLLLSLSATVPLALARTRV